MEIVKLASGHEMPMLGIGTWKLKGKECTESVRKALQLGHIHVDTASIYGNQKEIGEALKGVDRKSLFITSKIWRDDLHHDDVIKSCNKILEELGIDYLDLCLIHFPNAEVPMKETFDALAELVEQGKTRSIGVSNFNVEQLEEAIQVSKVPVCVNQVEYHPYLNQEALLKFCKEKGVVLTAYCPLARQHILEDKVLNSIAAKYGKTVPQVSLRWLLQKGIVVIPKAASEQHLKENMGVFGWKFSDEDMQRINEIPTEKRLVDIDYYNRGGLPSGVKRN